MRVEMSRSDLINSVQNKKQESKSIEFTPILLLDSSGSMGGGKYNKAIEGLQKLAEELKEGWFIEFSGASKIIVQQFINGQINNKFIGDMTALNDAINSAYKITLNSKNRCLINVFTDGGENGSNTKTSTAVDYIQDMVKNGHTFTFMCTKEDYKTIKNTYKVPESNILAYENNSKGVEEAYTATRGALNLYKKSLAAGENVTLGFYSKILK